MNGRDDFTDLHFLTLGHDGVEHARGFGRDLRRNFVGLEGKERIAGVDEITGLFVPDGNDSAGDRFANCGNFYFDGHPRLTKRRKNSWSNQNVRVAAAFAAAKAKLNKQTLAAASASTTR